ncbi:MipA/OmpV family protein [Candidatus Entotheonella palauensis]|uniref:MltA-interacting MipA family protein n=1 Tax=Candidatus Entotheonella gemina TaxID=1429439 RepID=W4M813_9BACT|nr:MipA/OmpV family protein [Candidatus Entotheonella palauensis]ETX06330.1 MAG: hypothetical protein ETSY2_17785 [Candidatus Entotheonella gemina]
MVINSEWRWKPLGLFWFAAVCMSVFTLGQPAFAQPLKGFVGIGAATIPDFEGSSDYSVVPFLVGRLRLEPYYIQFLGTGLRTNMVAHEFWRAGPVLRYRFSRNDVDNAVVDRLRRVDAAFEIGGFVGIEKRNVFQPRDTVSARIELRQDIAGGHKGWLLDLGASYTYRLARRWRLVVGSSVTIASANYMDAYFSIDADNASRSGLARFDADGGLKDLGLSMVAAYGITRRWGLLARAGYTRLLDDAANSPIVEDEGSANQFLGALGVSYRF